MMVLNVNGKEVVLDDATIDELHRQENIEWAKGILQNYDLGKPFEDISDEEFEEYANKLEDKMLENNGAMECEIADEMFP